MKMYERLEKYLIGEQIDSYPFEIFSLLESLAWNLGYSTSDLSNIDIFDKVSEIAYNQYDLDIHTVGLNQTSIGEVMGTTVAYPINGTSYAENYFLKDYSQLKEFPNNISDISDIYIKKIEYAVNIRKRNPQYYIQTGICAPMTIASGIRSPDLILRDTRKNPRELKDLLELSLNYIIEWIKIFTNEFGPTRVSISDPLSSLDVLAPKQFCEFSEPYFSRLIEEVYLITGIKPKVHICGKSSGIWEYLSTLPISIFSIDNIENIKDANQIIGDSITIMGNVPPVEVMKLGDMQDVENAVKRCIKEGKEVKAGHILATGCDIPYNVPLENLEAFAKCAKSYKQ